MLARGTLQLRSLLFAAAAHPHSTSPALRRGLALRIRMLQAGASPTPPAAGGFEELGLSPLLATALRAGGIVEPTAVQRTAFDAVLTGEDVVLLSETGTGKTLAYALPLVQRLLESRAAAASAAEDAGGEPTRRLSRRDRPADQILVLVPNRDLCAQVFATFHQLAQALPASAGLAAPLSVSSLASHLGADADADVVIATPALALRAWRGPEAVRSVVLDESDMLLAGSFKPAARAGYPIEQIIAAVKRSAKLETLARREEGDGEVASALRRGGARGLHGQEGRAARAELWSAKQFVLAGATMPNHGNKNAELHAKRLFPLATWHVQERVHREKAELRQFFVRVDEGTRGEALRNALRHGPAGRVIVFANSPRSAAVAYEEAASELGAEACAQYHKGVMPSERASLLQTFAEPGSALRVLVCTGLAARGIDFVDVAHVLQYDVATNAVEFMHRIGRTARAGKSGVATTLYTEERQELVHALRDALTAGQPIEHLFSRKRSFKIAIKRERKRGGGERA